MEQIGEAPEEVPFEIPNKWKWVRFQDVGSFISGWTPKAEELQKVCNKGCVPYFKIADMNQQGNEIWLQKTSSFLKKSERTRTFFRGTIVYPKNGGAVFTNKRRLLNQESVVDLNTGGYVPGKFLDIGYAYNIFLGLDFRTISKGTALPTLDQTKLRNYLIPLPPLAEQRRIVAKISQLFDQIERAEKAYNELSGHLSERFRQLCLEKTIQGKLVPQLESEPEVEQIGNAPEEVPFEIPKKWKWVQLKTIFAKRSTINPVDYGESKVELWSIPAFDKGKPEVVPARLIGSSKKVVVEGDVLLSKIVPHIKRAWVVSETNGYEKLASTEWIVFHSNDFFPNFLTMALTEPHFHSSLMSTISGMGSLKRANPQKVGELYIPCPSLAEQHRIVARLNKLLASINQLGD